MLQTFYPDLYMDSAYGIDYEEYYRRGFRGIIFDIETGLFRVDNEYITQLRLIGEGQGYAMVRKALQRNGILADKEVESEFCIEVGDLKKEGSFTVYSQQGDVSKADTIEELLEKILNNATIC